MQQLLAVGLGGFIGAIARYALTGLMQRKFPEFFPAGTLLVNVLGCLVIGVLMAFVVKERGTLSDHETLRLFLITGILGSLTTFSTFGYETVQFIQDSNLRMATWNVAGNLVLGFAAVWLGFWLGVAIDGTFAR